MSAATDLLTLRPDGLYCPGGDFYIDPVRPVSNAVVTHAHGDHCRPGSAALLATPETCAIARTRYGEGAFAALQPLTYGESIGIGDVTVRLVPAGHVLGAAQVVIERGGTRAIVSGDYKRSYDPTCVPFELVPCDLFVTEATFGLPVFRHPPVQEELGRLLRSIETFPDRTHVLGVYALGKAQRVIAELRRLGWERTIYVHGALTKLCALYETLGVPLGPVEQIRVDRKIDTAGEIVLAPPSAIQDRWARRLTNPLPVGISGWMQVRARARQRRVELPLVVSDHCDWDGLTRTITETGAEVVWVTHGAEEALCHWCLQQGIDAAPLSIAGRGDEDA
ncbi:MAG: ligase-associated DNA damage response exonuclease [Pseudomonadota bacterium]